MRKDAGCAGNATKLVNLARFSGNRQGKKKRPDKLDIKTKDEFLGWNEKTALEASWIKLYQC